MENEISHRIIAAAVEVHKTLGGPGLLENIYESSLDFLHNLPNVPLPGSEPGTRARARLGGYARSLV